MKKTNHPCRVVFGLALGILVASASIAAANHIDTAAVTQLTCDSFTITLSASDLNPGQNYEINWSISATGTCFPPSTADYSITFTAPSSGTFSTTVTKTFPAPDCPPTFTGSATLAGENTIPIIWPNGQTSDTINCPSPTPTPTPTPTPCPPCPTSSIQSNFNGTGIPAGDTVWFNAHIKANGIPSSGATINFSCSTITSSAFSATVPNGVIIFSPNATCATTTFSNNTWTTIVPVSGSDEIFLTGLALPVPSGLPGGGISPTWSGIFSSSVPGVSVQWQWGAAAYTCWPAAPGVYNMLNVKPTHQNACNVNNGDHAGTPESKAFQCVTGGATGGGGSNFTGSWSGTVSTGQLCVP
jgi:hypothetical protein